MQVQPVDPFDFPRHVVLQDRGHTLWYAHGRLQWLDGPRGPLTAARSQGTAMVYPMRLVPRHRSLAM